jgi:hypothetical protein
MQTTTYQVEWTGNGAEYEVYSYPDFEVIGVYSSRQDAEAKAKELNEKLK